MEYLRLALLCTSKLMDLKALYSPELPNPLFHIGLRSKERREGPESRVYGGRVQIGCRLVWRIAGSDFSVRPKTRDWDWGVGLWCRERPRTLGRRLAGGVGGRAVLSSGK